MPTETRRGVCAVGILIQREFVVDGDDRREFERQSREGVWVNMRYNGAQMIAFGSWALGGPGDVMVTHSAYADFDHWTATRPWGTFNSDTERIEETKSIRAVFAGRNRLVRHSSARVIFYDDARSEPQPFYRNRGDDLSAPPRTFGRQSVVAETIYAVAPDDRDSMLAASDTVWAWQVEHGARLLIAGEDPLGSPGAVVAYVAHRTISDWERSTRALAAEAPDAVKKAANERDWAAAQQTTQLLMVQTDFGEAV